MKSWPSRFLIVSSIQSLACHNVSSCHAVFVHFTVVLRIIMVQHITLPKLLVHLTCCWFPDCSNRSCCGTAQVVELLLLSCVFSTVTCIPVCIEATVAWLHVSEWNLRSKIRSQTSTVPNISVSGASGGFSKKQQRKLRTTIKYFTDSLSSCSIFPLFSYRLQWDLCFWNTSKLHPNVPNDTGQYLL